MRGAVNSSVYNKHSSRSSFIFIKFPIQFSLWSKKHEVHKYETPGKEGCESLLRKEMDNRRPDE